MKTYNLYITVRVSVTSTLETLSATVQEFEQDTDYQFSDTENVKIAETEILTTQPFDTNYPKL